MADEHGILNALTERTMGDALDTAASSGAQTISLYDVSDFDESGGSVLINGTVYTYDTVDMDADTIHLTTGLVAGGSANDLASVWNADNGVVVTERVALVTVDSQENGDPISADVDYSLATTLGQGTLAAGQSVTLVRDGAGYRVTAVHGKSNQAVQVARASTLYSGVGVPAFSASQGDLYIRTDDPTTSGHRLYMNTALGSSWTGIV